MRSASNNYHDLLGSFSLSTDRIGALFETFVYIQLSNTLKSQDRKFRLSNYRTSNDAEVDFILELDNETYAIELIGPRGLLCRSDLPSQINRLRETYAQTFSLVGRVANDRHI